MPRIKNAKNVILDAALELFSKHGYDGVGLREIAGAVCIRESSLYKHFTNKRDLFDTLVKQMKEEYDKRAASLNISYDSEMLERYKAISEEELIKLSGDLFSYLARDERTIKFRKILIMEQFRNETIGKIYTESYYDHVIAYQSYIFKKLIDAGVLTYSDPDIAALHFYSPLFLLLMNCDNKKMSVPEALLKVSDHIRQFMKLYSKKG